MIINDEINYINSMIIKDRIKDKIYALLTTNQVIDTNYINYVVL